MNLNNNTYVVIMAGGVGSRFWPFSREGMPKQFLDILGIGKSLLRLTFERFLHLCPAENIYVVTHEKYGDMVQQELPELSPGQILQEPSRNNTAPCVAYAAFKLAAVNPDANMVVAPADHLILDQKAFIGCLEKALVFAEHNEALLTLGIQPTRPDTGYGYICYDKINEQDGVFKVERFTEKPPLEKAQWFLEQGNYLWNAGIFIWKASKVLKELEMHSPDIYGILCKGIGIYNTPQETTFIHEHYPSTPKISIDYALMERSSQVFTVPATFDWTDLGTWGSLFAELQKDEHHNGVMAHRTFLKDVDNTLIKGTKGKLIVAKGLHDYIVVDTDDVLLIFPKSEEQKIKEITQEIDKLGLGEAYL